MSLSKIILLPSLAGLLFMLAGCATTEPLGEWRQPGFNEKIDNILVIGVTSRSTRRRVYEDKFVEALGAAGVDASPSYRLITSTLKLSRESVEAAIQGQNIGGVLVTHLVGVDEKQVYQMPDGDEEARNYFSYRDRAWEQVESGYHRQYRRFTLETNLYQTTTGELVWSMQSVVMDASRPRHVIEEQIRLAVESMLRQGVIDGD